MESGETASQAREHHSSISNSNKDPNPEMNTNDTKRKQILRWFYDRNANASSHRGKNGAAVKISDVKKGLKEAYSMKPAEVVSNLTYLIDKGWINQSEVARRWQRDSC